MKKNMKFDQRRHNGFTIVELVVVIAIIAILAAVLIPTLSHMIERANVTADIQTVKNLNTALKMDIAGHPTLHDALAAAKRSGLNESSVTDNRSKKHFIAWDRTNDRFVLVEKEEDADGANAYIFPAASGEETGKIAAKDKYNFFVIYQEMPDVSEQNYGIYLAASVNVSEATVRTGFDAGDNFYLKNLTYENNGTARDDILIRTNGGCVCTYNGYVNENNAADGDTITHYGEAGTQTIFCADNSFHEKGAATKSEIKKGHYILENGSIVANIEASASEGDVTIDLERGSVQGNVENTNTENSVTINGKTGATTVNLVAKLDGGALNVTFAEQPNYANTTDINETNTNEKAVYITGVGAKTKGVNNCEAPATSVYCENGHDYVLIAGYSVKVCSRCGGYAFTETKQEEEAPKENEYQVDVLEDGLTVQVNKSHEHRYVDDNEHRVWTWTAGNPLPTAVLKLVCAADGENCKQTETVLFPDEARKREFTIEVTTKATCKTKGTHTYTATYQKSDEETFTSSKDYEDIPALGHDLVHHEAKAATCTEIGWEAHDTCTRCDYTTYAEISALGHDLVHHDAKEATCTEIGWNAYDTCSRCDYTTYVEIPALGHNLIHYDAKAATCTEIGWNAYDACSRCDYTTRVENPALGHTPNAAVKEETTTGYDSVVYCSVCNAELSREHVALYASFKKKFKNTDQYLYRVGNINTVSLSSLFEKIGDANIGNLNVTIAPIAGASGTYNENKTTWDNGTIQFTGTGVVTVSIQDGDGPVCSLNLEVVDAKNVTTAESATSNNVVLLKDVSFTTLKISDGYTLFGNGFAMTASADSYSSNLTSGFITLSNGTIDNVQVVCPVFSAAYMYTGQLQSPAYTSSNNVKYYYNTKSAIATIGNASILNSYVSGGRAAIHSNNGITRIENTMIVGGALANILVSPSVEKVVLSDVVTEQSPKQATVNDTTKKTVGFGILALVDSTGSCAQFDLKNTLKQYNWASKGDSSYVPSEATPVINVALSKTEYCHTINNKTCINTGFAFMNDEGASIPDPTSKINDERSNKNQIPYQMTSIYNYKAYVYSYVNSNGTDENLLHCPEYAPEQYSTIAPKLTVGGLTSSLTYECKFENAEWQNIVTATEECVFAFNNLLLTKNGESVSYILKDHSGNVISSPTFSMSGINTTEYSIEAEYEGSTFTYILILQSKVEKIEGPKLTAQDYKPGLCVANSYGGTWSGAAPALEGVTIRYYSSKEKKYVDLSLTTLTPSKKGKQNGTNNTWTYEGDDFSLTITGGKVHDKNGVYAMPVVCDGKLYFVASNTNGLVNSGNTARNVPVNYTFTANGDSLTFSHTWSVAENKDDEYNYSDFVTGTKTKLEESGSEEPFCLLPGTMITLADGTQKAVEELTGEEMLLVWNLKTGSYDVAPIVFVDSEAESEYEVIRLYFEDGTEVGVISEHGFWDYDLNRYVYLDANAAEYIGHTFAKQNGDVLESVKLVDVVIATETTTAWSPVTAEHLCYFAEGMLSMPGGISGLFNIFEVNADTMAYDEEKMANDIATYGLLTIEDFGGMISEDMFEAFNGQYLGIAVAKGLLTWEDIAYLAQRYAPLCEQ